MVLLNPDRRMTEEQEMMSQKGLSFKGRGPEVEDQPKEHVDDEEKVVREESKVEED